MVNYIIQVILFQLLFLAIYDFVLKRETFFTANRFYLLITPILSFFIPFVKVRSLQTEYTNEISILLPEIVLSPQSVIEKSKVVQSMDYNYVAIVFWIGFTFFLGVFLIKIFKLKSLIKASQVQLYKDFKLVRVYKTRKAFSFFNYIFLGEEISEEDKRKVIKHEIVHSRQKHSADLMVFELLKIGMWFNPLLYIFQNRIAEVHEFISDSFVIKTTTREVYVNTLLNELFEVDDFSFVNQFSNKSILKKRILMITKRKSKQIMRAKYLLLFPLLLSMLFYVSCSDEFQNIDTVLAKKQPQKTYLFSKEGLKEMERSTFNKVKESYLDFLIGISMGDVPEGWREISKNELTKYEVSEYDEVFKRFENLDLKSTSVGMEFEYKLYRNEDNRAILGMMSKFDMNKKSNPITKQNVSNSNLDIPFSIIDKIPTFPGCVENDKMCFNQKMQQHFVTHFNHKLPNQLGLKTGKKRLLMMFKIDSLGNVENIKVKAPAKELEIEAKRILKKLPKMIPGEQNGQKVNVKYTLPIRIDVE